MVLEDEDIRCTSVAGHKLPVGSDTATALRDELSESSVVIGLITSTSVDSSWVLFELGATWGARRHLKPILTDEIEYKDLPGPLSGSHAARLSNKGDLSQCIEEVTNIVGATSRSRAKIDKAIDDLISTHASFLSSKVPKSSKTKVATKSKEPLFEGVPFSELVKLLKNESIVVPAKLTGGKEDVRKPLFDLFVLNTKALSDGIQSNSDRDSPAGFLYAEVGLRLLPYGLAQFDKLPVSQSKWYKRISLSKEGEKFIVHYRRLESAE